MAKQMPPQPNLKAVTCPAMHVSGSISCVEMQQHHALFTSDLSVNEFLLVREAGFDPVGLVVGSSIYHIGYQQANWNQNQEMTVLTQAMYHARELAMTRMEEEANALGADGIVGVRLEVDAPRVGRVAGRVCRHRHRIRAAATGNPPQRRKASRSPAISPARISGPCCVRLSPGWHGDGQLRLPCRPPGATGQWFKQDGPERGDDELSPRPSTTPRTGHGAHAGRGGSSLQAQGIVGTQIQEKQSRLGFARDRVLCRRHGSHPHLGYPRGASTFALAAAE